VLNFSGHERKANQNYTKISSLPHLECLSSTTQTTTNVGKDVAKQEPLYTVGRNVNYCSYYGNQYTDSLKTKNRIQ
jgi:hypothetical protein